MNILMLGWELPPHMSGGLGTACDGLLAGLGALGSTRTTFVLPRLGGEEQGYGASLIAVKDGSGAPLDLVTSAYGCSIGADVRAYAASIGRVTAGVQFDLIHAHDWLTIPAALELKRRSGKPLCVHIHSTEIDRSGPGASADILAIERAGMHAADLIVAVSQAVRRQLIEQFGVSPKKICVIYNGVRTESWPARRRLGREGMPLAVFAGRVTYQKGPHYFVQAAQRLRERQPDLRFVLAGAGDMLDSTMALASELGIADSFSFPGFLDHNSLQALFAQADVFVMPSLSEPFGIVALEAIAASVPVVMSARAGVAEVIASAYKVEPWDIDAIADAVDAMLNDPVAAADMADAARREAQKWDWNRAAKTLTAQYADLIEHAGNVGKRESDIVSV